MRRRPFLLPFLILGLGVALVVIYFTAQMRMRIPPQISVVREEWVPRGNVPNAYLRVHYEMKNATSFPVRVYRVDVQGPHTLFGGDIDALHPGTVVLLKPGQVYTGAIVISLPDGEPAMDAAFVVSWDPACASWLRPLFYRLDDVRRHLLNIPPDPVPAPGSPPPPPSILEGRSDQLPQIRFERPKRSTP